MRIDIITAVPALLDSPFAHSIMKRAQDKGFLEIHVHNLHDYSKNKYRQVDDYQFGGGAGMVMMIEPIDKCIEKLKSERNYDCVIYMTPDGQQWTQSMANTFSMYENIIILCGHYKGVDERVRELHITHEISIGDYVISGGELAAAIVADSIVRLIPGVLGDEQSALSDSHQDGLLSPPIYTRPVEYRGLKVPDVLMSGNHSAIEKWRAEEALRRTRERRPDMLEGM
ncbi:MAG: tRNA (guanosine(37)-N1)-methyltransferase TrmD, partial [Flavobacteriales bacterium]|nr:tRNA (guanosine(37)-N1)-methyltransferase TrmD [Flavobacteriales bacterium]